MDPDLPGMTADELHNKFGEMVHAAGENGYKAIAVFVNEDLFKDQLGFWLQTNLDPPRLRFVLTQLLENVIEE